MAKKVVGVVKVRVAAGEATPAPPLGPALGQKQVPIAAFVKDFNARTIKDKGNIVNTYITVYDDKSYSFVTKGVSVVSLIKKELGIQKGSAVPNKTKVAKITSAQLEKLAKEKMTYLSANDLEGAKRIIAGTARSMGITVEG